MSKHRPVSDGNRFSRAPLALSRTGDGKSVEKCHFGNCDEPCFAGLPVCLFCGVMVSRFMNDMWTHVHENPIRECGLSGPEYLTLRDYADEVASKPPSSVVVNPKSFVYYLMVGPTTVKIGTTKNLRSRMAGLRTDAQYVVALEPGSFDLERTRHHQFKDDRLHTRREDFRLSDALKQHIDSLEPQREEHLAVALARETTRL